jgi:Replication-relaxation
MAGGGDFVGNQYLYRFRLPDVAIGNQKIYTLGSKGRDFLESELGLSASWYFRPEKVRHLSYGQIMHSLVLTRFLVGSHWWACGSGGEFKIGEVRICYDLAGTPVSVPVGDGEEVETLPVVPDAWIVFERVKAGGRVSYRVLLEVDRGTMYRQRIKRHVRARIEFVRSGGYERMFGTKAVLIVYATTGGRAEDTESRRRSLCGWTMEVLEEMRLSKWAGLFRFCALSFGEMYKEAPFAKRVWYLPDQERPVGLFEG